MAVSDSMASAWWSMTGPGPSSSEGDSPFLENDIYTSTQDLLNSGDDTKDDLTFSCLK